MPLRIGLKKLDKKQWQKWSERQVPVRACVLLAISASLTRPQALKGGLRRDCCFGAPHADTGQNACCGCSCCCIGRGCCIGKGCCIAICSMQ